MTRKFVPRLAPLNPELPHVWCDFNACGWGPEPDDDSFYSFDRSVVECEFENLVDRVVVLYDSDDPNDDQQIVACEAVIERFDSALVDNPDVHACKYRAKPIEASWYWGRAPWRILRDDVR